MDWIRKTSTFTPPSATVTLAAITLGFLLPGFACAQVVTNGDFENVTIGSPYISTNPSVVPGWTRSGSPGDGLLVRVGYTDPDGSVTTAGHGNQFVILGGGQSGSASANWTTVVTGLTPNTTYSLSFLIANEGEASSQNLTVSFPSGSSTAPQTFSTTTGAGQSYWKSWETKSMSFAASATAVTIQFSANQRYDIGLDYVQVTPVSSGVSVLAGPVLTKSVPDPANNCPVTAPPGVTSFLVSDPIVTVWFALGGLTTQSSVLARFSLNGVPQPSLDSSYLPPSSPGAYVFCPSFLPQGSAGAIGQWTLTVSVNNQPVATFPPFTVASASGGGVFIGIWNSPTLGTVTITPGNGSTVNGSFTGSGFFPGGTFTGTVTGTQCGGTYVNNNGGTGVIIIVIIIGGGGFTGTFTPNGGSPIPVSGISSSSGGSTGGGGPGGGFVGTWSSPSLGTVIIVLGSGTTLTGSFTGGSSFPGGGTFSCTVIGNQCGGPYTPSGGVSGTITILIIPNSGGSSFGGTCIPTGGASTPIPVSGTMTSPGPGTGGGGTCGINITNDTSTAPVNLTTEGTADWVTIGLDPIAADNCPAGFGKPTCAPKQRKATATPLIGPLQVIGGADTYVNYYGNDLRQLSWTATDGKVPTVSSNHGGVYVEYGGFSITAPADTTARTFILHVSMTLDVGPSTLTVHLSDGSVPDQTPHISNIASNGADFNFRIVYQASKPNQTLTVTLQQDDLKHGGYLNFQGAALSVGGTVTGTCAGGSGGGGVGTPKIAVSTTTLDFGNVTVGQNPPAELTLNVSSTGTAPLTLSSLTIQNSAFTLVSPPQTPYTVGDAALQLRVRFTPTAAGAQSGTLKIVSNDPDPTRSSLTINLSGTGTTGGGQPGCSYDVRPTSLTDATGTGISGVIFVSSPPGCAWTTTVPVPWVTLSPVSGTGSGGVGYSVAANNTGASRTTTLTVATTPITVQQGSASACTYSLDSSNKNVSGIQSGFGVTVTVAGSSCAAWTFSIPATVPWIHPASPSSLTGTNTATFVVDANPGPSARTATITINTPAGAKTVTISQDPPPCSYTLSPSSSPTIPSSGTSDVGVSLHVGVTGAVCAWSVTSPADANSQWVHVTSATSATGSGDINYTADPNNTTSSRSVTLTITGKNPSTKLSYTITQAPGTQNTGPVPVISPGGVVNAASFIPANLPGGVLAQGCFFSIFGNGLGPTPSLQADKYPLGIALGNVSVKVTQGSISVNALPVFVAPFQVNAVMPSNAPTGDVQVTVTFNSATSAPAAAKVVVSNFGAFAVSGGRGPGIVQNVISDSQRPLNSSSGPATPGQYVTLWGTGLGPLPNSGSDSLPPAAGTLPIPVKVFVGGKLADNKAEFFYSGRGPGLAGIDQFNFRVPQDTPLGCYVPVQVQVADTYYSNTVSMAISSDGSACNDQNPLSTRARTGGRNGSVTLIRLNISDTGGLGNGSIDLGMAGFSQKAAAGDLGFDLYSSLPPLNTCTYYNNLDVLNGVLGLQLPSQGSPDGIDAGSAISVKGARGTQALPYSDTNTAKSPYLGLFGGTGTIGALAPGGPFLDPGAYTVSGPGGKDVGPFSFALNVPTGVTWTNRDQISTVDRSQPLTINWNGGDPATQVGLILGFSTNPNTKVSGGFACLVPLDSGTFTVQPGNMANLPGGASAANAQSKILFVTVPRADQAVKFNTSAAPGLDNGFGLYAIGDLRTVTFK